MLARACFLSICWGFVRLRYVFVYVTRLYFDEDHKDKTRRILCPDLKHFLVLPSRAWFLSVCSLFVFSFVWSKLIIFGLLLHTLAISFGMDFRLRTIMMIMMTMIRSAHIFLLTSSEPGNKCVCIASTTHTVPSQNPPQIPARMSTKTCRKGSG